MTLPREERLKTLGLWPVWRLRGAEAETVATGVVEAEVAPSPPAPPPKGEGLGEREQRIQTRATDQTIAPQNWDALRQSVQTCTRCPLHETRTKPVFGVGDIEADWLIVGEAPGADEDRQGEPFVGQAGKVLDGMLAAIGLTRGDNVYIANVLKSRPPGNRDPKVEEVAACIPYLERQIELIRPRIILALGRFAAQSLLATDTSITRLRGHVHAYRGVNMVVTYHPAYLLRNPADKNKVWEDLCLARKTLLSSPPKSNTGV